ncbi:fungal-specific transcription factor domain-containing protein [Entophlyctis helioformis]|nr:fungal-specific transcription factor domain-containing protein [Entophlyctis helioformis]
MAPGQGPTAAPGLAGSGSPAVSLPQNTAPAFFRVAAHSAAAPVSQSAPRPHDDDVAHDSYGHHASHALYQQQQQQQQQQAGSSNYDNANYHSNDNDEDAGAPKRQRASKACDTCNKKKVRCDGVQPLCTNCRNSGQSCTYTRIARKRGPKPGYIEELEGRVKELEELLGQLPPGEQAIDDLGYAAAMAAVAAATGAYNGGDEASETSNDGGMSGTRSRRRSSVAFVKSEDRQPHADDLAEADRHTGQFAQGPASQPGPGDAAVGASATSRPGPYSPQEAPSAMDTGLISTSAPRGPEQYADYRPDLIDFFFSNVYPFFPVLHRPSFVKNARSENPLLLNALYAVSAHYAYPSMPGMSMHYFSTARAFVDRAIEQPTYVTVIGLILLSLFVSNAGQTTEAWVYFGMAVRIAQQMRLHCEPSLERVAYSEHIQEYRRRIWWALYETDRFMCLTSKLPFAIREMDFKVNYPSTELVWLRSRPKRYASGYGNGQGLGQGQADAGSNGYEYGSGAGGQDSMDTQGGDADGPGMMDTAIPEYFTHSARMALGRDGLVASASASGMHSGSSTGGGSNGNGHDGSSAAQRNHHDPTRPDFDPLVSLESYYMQLLEITTKIVALERSRRPAVQGSGHGSYANGDLLDASPAHESAYQSAALDRSLSEWFQQAPAWLQSEPRRYAVGLGFLGGAGVNGAVLALPAGSLPTETGLPPWKVAFVQIMFYYSRLIVHMHALDKVVAQATHLARAAAIQATAAAAQAGTEADRDAAVAAATSAARAAMEHPTLHACVECALMIASLNDAFLADNPEFRYISPHVYLGLCLAGEALLLSVQAAQQPYAPPTAFMPRVPEYPPRRSGTDGTDGMDGTDSDAAGYNPSVRIEQTLADGYVPAVLAVVDRLLDSLGALSRISTLASQGLATLVAKRQAVTRL